MLLFWKELGVSTEGPANHPQLDLLVVTEALQHVPPAANYGTIFTTLFSGENVCCVNNTRDLCKPLHFRELYGCSANSHNTLLGGKALSCLLYKREPRSQHRIFPRPNGQSVDFLPEAATLLLESTNNFPPTEKLPEVLSWM